MGREKERERKSKSEKYREKEFEIRETKGDGEGSRDERRVRQKKDILGEKKERNRGRDIEMKTVLLCFV